MTKPLSIGQIMAMSFLLPGNLACDALGFTRQNDLVRMLVNSLFWTVIGVFVVVLSI